MLHAVIMAGGSGTRFWPASRDDCPKQLLNLTGEATMIQSTVARLEGMVDHADMLVVTNQRLVEAVRQQLPMLPASAVIGEPCRRDTAPCIGLAAALIASQDPDAIMIVLPADHVISTVAQFQAAMQLAAELVRADASRLVTFGIRPTYPAESFGYIERSKPLQDHGLPHDGIPVFQVKQFREKPSAAVARQYLEAGNFYWNSGIFVWRAKTILAKLQQREPLMYEHLMRIAASTERPDFEAVLTREFAAIDGKSIDYAVMEHADNVMVIEAPFDWDDLGSWQSLARLRGEDHEGNTIVGRHLGIQTTGTIVRTEDEHLVVTVGLKDCIVVHSDHITLVADKHCEEQVREVVKQLREKGWTQFL